MGIRPFLHFAKNMFFVVLFMGNYTVSLSSSLLGHPVLYSSPSRLEHIVQHLLLHLWRRQDLADRAHGRDHLLVRLGGQLGALVLLLGLKDVLHLLADVLQAKRKRKNMDKTGYFLNSFSIRGPYI